MIIADKGPKTGWDTKFHSEFYGFVGTVNFLAVEPDKLPWNTTKTDVDLNNPAYLAALADMRKFAEKWRSFQQQRKRSGLPKPPPPKDKTARKRPATKAKIGPTKKAISKPISKTDHHDFRTVLPDDVEEKYCFDKHLALVHEAKALDLADFPYSGLALTRMLFESSVITYADRHNLTTAMKAHAIGMRTKKRGKKLTPEDEKKLIPSVEEMISYLDSNPTVWGATKGNFLKHNLKRMATHMPRINGVLHHPYQPIHTSEAFQIRNEVLTLLRHLIEK